MSGELKMEGLGRVPPDPIPATDSPDSAAVSFTHSFHFFSYLLLGPAPAVCQTF